MTTRTTEPSSAEDRPRALRPELAAIFRPQLPSLAEEIILAIRDKIPEFARPIDGPYGQIMRTGVQQALTSFVDRIADPGTSLAHRDEVARMLGRHQAEEGRSLDSLQAAYRVGAHIAWHRAMAVGHEAELSSADMSMLADAVLGYMNELAELSVQGYRELRAASAEEQQAARRRLLQLILDRDQPVPHRALVDLAEDANWPLPEQVTAVAVQAAAAAGPGVLGEADGSASSGVARGADEAGVARGADEAGVARGADEAGVARGADEAGVAGVTAGADGAGGTGAGEAAGTGTGAGAGTGIGAKAVPAEGDVLASLDEGQPHMLIPGEACPGREAALLARLGGRRAAIGLTVPLLDAADSLRWAQQALALAESGAVEAGQIVHCEDHLVTLWLMSDRALADQVRKRQLGALDGLTPRQQERLTETFGAWLETRGTAAEIADRLQVHPQTVRYRIRQLERTLGDQFGDPEARFAMEMVLRVMRVRDRAARRDSDPS
jgi:DNA-binding CsgD family transcriptional regulator